MVDVVIAKMAYLAFCYLFAGFRSGDRMQSSGRPDSLWDAAT